MYEISDARALVYDANPDLAAEMQHKYERDAHVTRSGILVMRLHANRQLSRATNPDQWSALTGISMLQPDYTNGPVQEFYDFPEELADVPYHLKLEAAEFGSKNSDGTIIAGVNGEKLRSYRREAYRDDPHGAVVFSNSAMGLVRLNKGYGDEPGVLGVHTSTLGVVDSLITATHERKFLLRAKGLKTMQIPDNKFLEIGQQRYGQDIEEWVPAVHALYDRLTCDRQPCNGHYVEEAA